MYLILTVLIGIGVWVISYGPLDPQAARAAELRDQASHAQCLALLDAELAEPSTDGDDLRDA